MLYVVSCSVITGLDKNTKSAELKSWNKKFWFKQNATRFAIEMSKSMDLVVVAFVTGKVVYVFPL